MFRKMNFWRSLTATGKGKEPFHVGPQTIPSVITDHPLHLPLFLTNSKLAQTVVLGTFLLTCVLVGAGQNLSPGTAAIFDEISIAKRPALKGTIVRMTPTEVIIEVNRTKASVPINEIVRISYAGEPVELRTARRLAASRQFDLALKKLDEIKLVAVSRDLVSQDIEYYRASSTAGLALASKGNRDAALKVLQAFVSQHKNNYHHFSAVELLADLAIADAQYDMANRLAGELGKASWPAYQLRAAVLKGRALQSQKKYAEAIDRYEQVIGASQDIPGAEEPQKRAALGKMAALLASNNYPKRAPMAELHGYASSNYGDGGCCCFDFEMWQEEGQFGNITYIDAQVTTPGVIVTSVSDPVPGPGSQPSLLLSATAMRWYLPLPNGLWMAPQTLTACFSNVPTSGAAVTLIGYDSFGNTDESGLQTTTINIGETGECSYLPDFWMKDTMAPDLPEDFGVEPNSVSQLLWISRDIWVQTSPDTLITAGNYANEHLHQNPIYVNASTPNYVYVKVRNRGTSSNTGVEQLRVYWADANTGLPWPLTGSGVWTEIDCDTNTSVVDPCPMPFVGPGQDYVLQLPWVPPNPVTTGTNHYCLVARIESTPSFPFGMAVAEGVTLLQNVANNNNIAWKNVTVISAGAGTRPHRVFVRNTLDQAAPLMLRFSVPEKELRNHFLLHGDIVVDLGEAVMQKWRRGGKRAQGFAVVGKTTIKITDPSKAELGGLLFAPGEKQMIEVRMQLKPGARAPAGTTFNWDITQIAPLTKNGKPSQIGGERYTLTVPKRR